MKMAIYFYNLFSLQGFENKNIIFCLALYLAKIMFKRVSKGISLCTPLLPLPIA